jgi:hypothetical protein
MPPAVNLDAVNLNDEGLFERGDPHACFRTLRREDPVHWWPADEDVNGIGR